MKLILRTGRLLAEIAAWVFLITVALVLLALLLWTYRGSWTVFSFFLGLTGAINPLILIFLVAIVGLVVFFLVKQGKNRRWFLIGVFAVPFICLGVVGTWFELNQSHYKEEMISRFAFEPDVQPKKNWTCVQGRVRHGHFVGEWKQRRSYPDTVIGIPHGVGLFVKTLSRRSSWVYVGEWANGYAHGRGKYTEYDQESNTVDKVCDGTFERGTYVGTCKKGGHPTHEISTKNRRSSSLDLVIRTADLVRRCSHTLRADSGNELFPF